MKRLQDYISDSEAWVDNPAVGDDFAINIREECLVESHIVDVVEDGVVLAADEGMMRILESYGMLETADPYRREVSPPSPEEFEEGVAEGSDKLQGTPVISLKDLTDKDYTKDKYGRSVPKKLKKDDPRVKFYKEKDKQQGVAEEAPRTDTEINRQATTKYAEEIKRALENATGATVDTNLNQDGSVQIVINPRPNNRKLGYIVPNEEGGGATARNVSAAIEKYYRGFRQKGWRFDQPTQGQFTIAVSQQGVAEGSKKIPTITDPITGQQIPDYGNTLMMANLDTGGPKATAIQSMKKMYGDGNITFSKTSNGGYFIQHEDDFGDTHSHQYDPKTGKVDFRHVVRSTYYGESQGVAEGSLDTPGIEESQAELARIQELAGMPPSAMPSVQEGAMKNWLDDLYYEFQERHDLPRDIDDDSYLGVVAKFLRDQGVDPDRIEDIGELFLDRRDREEDDDHDYANHLDREQYDDEPMMDEAEYHGRNVPLSKPMQGDVKKFKVYVKNPATGNIKKVNFGDKTMRIKKSNPKRRKSFRARHNCANPGPRTKARYWSCRKW